MLSFYMDKLNTEICSLSYPANVENMVSS